MKKKIATFVCFLNGLSGVYASTLLGGAPFLEEGLRVEKNKLPQNNKPQEQSLNVDCQLKYTEFSPVVVRNMDTFSSLYGTEPEKLTKQKLAEELRSLGCIRFELYNLSEAVFQKVKAFVESSDKQGQQFVLKPGPIIEYLDPEVENKE